MRLRETFADFIIFGASISDVRRQRDHNLGARRPVDGRVLVEVKSGWLFGLRLPAPFSIICCVFIAGAPLHPGLDC